MLTFGGRLEVNMRKFIKTWDRIELNICIALLTMMVVLVFASAIGRFIGFPNPWSVEIAQIMYTWLTFAAASYAWRSNNHVAVDIFYRRMPKPIKKVCDIINLFLIGAFLVIITASTIDLAITNFERQLNAVPISYSFVTISVAFFGVFMIITTLLRLYATIFGKEEIVGGDHE